MSSYHPRIEGTNTVVAALVSGISTDSYGAISASVYETARLITLAPWLAGHTQRLLFLVSSQHRDGKWGGPDGYSLVPTLSATEALLTSLLQWRSGNEQMVGHENMVGDIVGAVDRGLRTLFRSLGNAARALSPDTIAAEIVIPALVAQVNRHLDRLVSEPVTGLDAWHGSGRLPLPDGMDKELLARLRYAVRQGRALPARLLHSLEAIGPVARGASFVHPTQGAVGCSPAATAAWLDDRSHQPSINYLEAVQRRGAGTVPGITPATVFERAWVLATLTEAGINVKAPPGLLDSLHAAFGEFGVSAGPGLPPDSDDTATVLYILAQLGTPRALDCLFSYQGDAYFNCFPDERTPSTSTNAHILRALGNQLEHDPTRRFHQQAAMRKISTWLRDCQESDGSWWDKWHASPFYATACCAITLHRYSRNTSIRAVARAVEWLIDSQREDGSWGRWNGSYEETAYAVRTLLQTCVIPAHGAVELAVIRGCIFLKRSAENQDHPSMWHGNDLYTPTRVVQAEGIAALHLAHTNPHIAAMVDQQLIEESEHGAEG